MPVDPDADPQTRCGQAVADVVRSLGLALKAASHPSKGVAEAVWDGDTLDVVYPCVVVSYTGLSEAYGKGGAGYDLIGYPVRVAVMDAEAKTDPRSQALWNGFRHKIERAFQSAYLAAVPESSHCTIEPYAVAEWEAQKYLAFRGGLVVRCWCRVPVTPVA